MRIFPLVKILSQSGNSLADIYDVKGSIAGIEQLETRELPIVHELGATIFSERLNGQMQRRTSGDILQSTTFDIEFDLVHSITRILGLCVNTDNSGRIATAAVYIRNAADDREVPIFLWEAGGPTIAARYRDNGAAAAATTMLANMGDVGILPNLLFGPGQPAGTSAMALRGLTTAFGAGTVEISMTFYRAFALITGLSSRGLPVPGW